MVFAFAGDSTITKFDMFRFHSFRGKLPQKNKLPLYPAVTPAGRLTHQTGKLKLRQRRKKAPSGKPKPFNQQIDM